MHSLGELGNVATWPVQNRAYGVVQSTSSGANGTETCLIKLLGVAPQIRAEHTANLL
jgi:hypothetical protein